MFRIQKGKTINFYLSSIFVTLLKLYSFSNESTVGCHTVLLDITFALQRECSRSESVLRGLSLENLQFLPGCGWLLYRFSDFLLQSKTMHLRSMSDSENCLEVGMYVWLSFCVYPVMNRRQSVPWPHTYPPLSMTPNWTKHLKKTHALCYSIKLTTVFVIS